MEDNNELIEKLEELKDGNTQRMAKLDAIIVSSRENIRMKCLETAVEYAKLQSKVNKFWSQDGLVEMAEEFYQFVKGEADKNGHKILAK